MTRQTLDEVVAQCRREHPTWPEVVVKTWCPAKKQLDPNILSILSIQGSDWPQTIPQLACPTLIVTADPERGGIVTPAIAARIQELNPRCAIAHIPGAGHHIRFEAYATYMGFVRNFLRGLPPG